MSINPINNSHSKTIIISKYFKLVAYVKNTSKYIKQAPGISSVLYIKPMFCNLWILFRDRYSRIKHLVPLLADHEQTKSASNSTAQTDQVNAPKRRTKIPSEWTVEQATNCRKHESPFRTSPTNLARYQRPSFTWPSVSFDYGLCSGKSTTQLPTNMGIRIIKLNVNFLVGRSRRHEFELFLGENNPQIKF